MIKAVLLHEVWMKHYRWPVTVCCGHDLRPFVVIVVLDT